MAGLIFPNVRAFAPLHMETDTETGQKAGLMVMLAVFLSPLLPIYT